MPHPSPPSRTATAAPRGAGALLLALALGAAASATDSLDGWRWQARPLLVFAPDGGHAGLSRQRAALAPYEIEHRERDVRVIWVVGETLQHGPDAEPGSGASASDLRQRFGITAAEFAVVLVGKDGGVKLRSTEPVDACSLHTLIDGMPMRRGQGGGLSRACTEP